MKIKVSKAMANFINKSSKVWGFKGVASVVEMTERGYALNLGSCAVWDAEMTGDYDYNTGMFKAIKILYPEEYYACPKYISTQNLTDELRRRGVKDEEGLAKMIRDMIEI